MPNHYTNIVVCYPGYEFDEHKFNSENRDLCQDVLPMPDEIRAVHTGYYPGPDGTDIRYWTGDTDAERKLVSGDEMTAKYGAACQLDWANKFWGTKWGTYDAKATATEGDGRPILITFNTAWSPPSILDKIGVWLMQTYGFEAVHFIGVDPSDGTIHTTSKANCTRKIYKDRGGGNGLPRNGFCGDNT